MDYNLDYFLKEMMEGVSLQDVAGKDEKWCLSNYYLIGGCVLAGSFANEVLSHPQQSPAHFSVALLNRLQVFGWKEVVPFQKLEKVN